MKISLHLVSLLAPVLSDEGLLGLSTAAVSDDPVAVADGISAFYRALSASNAPSASAYLQTILLRTDCVFSRAAATGDATRMYDRVNAELSVLHDLVQTSSTSLAQKLPQSARALCPQWQAGAFSVTAETLAEEYARGGYGLVRDCSALLFDAESSDFRPVPNVRPIQLSDLKEYEEEKQAAIDNTVAFLQNKPANNVLFYGDRGTGKSSTVHALLTEFAPRGLRLVQLTKAAIPLFPVIKEKLSRFPRLRFILFLDDLSFDEEDASYSALKAALEGSLATADNALIYVTTNRRHLVKETHSGRDGDDVHAADAREEALSLFDRFGLVITYIAPDKREYVSILQQILRDRDIRLSDEEATALAERYALRKGGRSPRAAKQLADMIQNGSAF